MRVLTDSRLLCRRMRLNLRVGSASGGASDAAELLALAYGPSEGCRQSANEFQHCAATPHESVKIPQREGTDGSAATRLQVRLPASSKANSTSTRSLSVSVSLCQQSGSGRASLPSDCTQVQHTLIRTGSLVPASKRNLACHFILHHHRPPVRPGSFHYFLLTHTRSV